MIIIIYNYNFDSKAKNMSLISWRPFSELDKFFEDEDWFLPVISRGEKIKPAMDIYETNKEVIAEVALPGIDPEKIEVSVENDVLRVSGGKEEKEEEKGKGYWRKELRKGFFERIIKLPMAVKENAVDATYEKGVLKIVMPKAETKPASKVKIKVKEK